MAKKIIKPKKSPEITKEMTIGKVLEDYPKSIFVFMDYGVHCVGCAFAQNDTIEGAAKIHRLDLKKLLKDLNKKIKNKERSK